MTHNLIMGAAPAKLSLEEGDHGIVPPWAGTHRTLDNGAPAFEVTLRDNVVDVKRCVTTRDSGGGEETRACVTLRPKRVFVGRSLRNPMTEFSGGHGPKFLGNTILLEFAGNRYVHVGESVVGFRTRAPIAWFLSPVGNSGVPSPYACDAEGSILLLGSGFALVAPPYPDEVLLDPYGAMFDRDLITTDEGRVPPRRPFIEKFEGITGFFIGTERFTLRYKPQAAREYDGTRRRFDGKRMYVVAHGKKRELTKAMYVGIMERFGKANGFAAVPNARTFLARDGKSCEARGVAGLRKFARPVARRRPSQPAKRAVKQQKNRSGHLKRPDVSTTT